MAKFKTIRRFFKVFPPTKVEDIKDEIINNNDFNIQDFEKEVIEIRKVTGYSEGHPRTGFFKVQMTKRASEVGTKGFPGFSFHSKYFLEFDKVNEVIYVFDCKVRILKEGRIKSEEIIAGDVTKAYTSNDVNVRMVSYTADHTI